MKESRSSCISSIRCTACAGACRACSTKCAPADSRPTKNDGSWVRGSADVTASRRSPPRRSTTSHERILPNRRTMTIIALAGVMLLRGLGPGQTEDYPSRPVRLIITTPAGSLVDVLGRLFAQDLSDRLGQTIVVDNRPGAMTQIGADALNRAPSDGYTLMIVTSEATMLPFLKKSYRHDPVKDFTPIALLATSWTVFAVNPKVPANTLAELIAYSKANPGRVRYGSGGVGGALHIAVEMLRLKTGADLVHVPYRGGGQAASDAVAPIRAISTTHTRAPSSISSRTSPWDFWCS